jgi:hypothetical protein
LQRVALPRVALQRVALPHVACDMSSRSRFPYQRPMAGPPAITYVKGDPGGSEAAESEVLHGPDPDELQRRRGSMRGLRRP